MFIQKNDKTPALYYWLAFVPALAFGVTCIGCVLEGLFLSPDIAGRFLAPSLQNAALASNFGINFLFTFIVGPAVLYYLLGGEFTKDLKKRNPAWSAFAALAFVASLATGYFFVGFNLDYLSGMLHNIGWHFVSPVTVNTFAILNGVATTIFLMYYLMKFLEYVQRAVIRHTMMETEDDRRDAVRLSDRGWVTKEDLYKAGMQLPTVMNWTEASLNTQYFSSNIRNVLANLDCHFEPDTFSAYELAHELLEAGLSTEEVTFPENSLQKALFDALIGRNNHGFGIVMRANIATIMTEIATLRLVQQGIREINNDNWQTVFKILGLPAYNAFSLYLTMVDSRIITPGIVIPEDEQHVPTHAQSTMRDKAIKEMGKLGYERWTISEYGATAAGTSADGHITTQWAHFKHYAMIAMHYQSRLSNSQASPAHDSQGYPEDLGIQSMKAQFTDPDGDGYRWRSHSRPLLLETEAMLVELALDPQARLSAENLALVQDEIEKETICWAVTGLSREDVETAIQKIHQLADELDRERYTPLVTKIPPQQDLIEKYSRKAWNAFLSLGVFGIIMAGLISTWWPFFEGFTQSVLNVLPHLDSVLYYASLGTEFFLETTLVIGVCMLMMRANQRDLLELPKLMAIAATLVSGYLYWHAHYADLVPFWQVIVGLAIVDLAYYALFVHQVDAPLRAAKKEEVVTTGYNPLKKQQRYHSWVMMHFVGICLLQFVSNAVQAGPHMLPTFDNLTFMGMAGMVSILITATTLLGYDSSTIMPSKEDGLGYTVTNCSILTIALFMPVGLNVLGYDMVHQIAASLLFAGVGLATTQLFMAPPKPAAATTFNAIGTVQLPHPTTAHSATAAPTSAQVQHASGETATAAAVTAGSSHGNGEQQSTTPSTDAAVQLASAETGDPTPTAGEQNRPSSRGSDTSYVSASAGPAPAPAEDDADHDNDQHTVSSLEYSVVDTTVQTIPRHLQLLVTEALRAYPDMRIVNPVSDQTPISPATLAAAEELATAIEARQSRNDTQTALASATADRRLQSFIGEDNVLCNHLQGLQPPAQDPQPYSWMNSSELTRV